MDANSRLTVQRESIYPDWTPFGIPIEPSDSTHLPSHPEFSRGQRDSVRPALYHHPESPDLSY